MEGGDLLTESLLQDKLDRGSCFSPIKYFLFYLLVEENTFMTIWVLIKKYFMFRIAWGYSFLNNAYFLIDFSNIVIDSAFSTV